MGKEPHEMTLAEYVRQQDELPLGQGLPSYEYKKALEMARQEFPLESPEFDAAYESAIRKLRSEHAAWQHGSLCRQAKLNERAGAVRA